MIFVDTNYFARFLLRDVEFQFNKVQKLFKNGVEGKIELFSSTIVIFELYWLFKNYYKKTKSEVIDILEKTLKLDFIKIEERRIIINSLELYKNTSLEFEDCYNIVYAENQGVRSFSTFDKKIINYFNKNK